MVNKKILFLLAPLSLFITSCVKERPPAPGSTASVKQDYIKAAQFFNKLGLAAMVEQNYAKAIANFKHAVQLNPYDPELWKNLGEAYTAAKFFKKAEEAFKRALTLKPDYGEVYYDLGMLYTEWGKYKKAVEWFKKAAQLDTYAERYKAFYALARLYKRLGDEKNYVQMLKRAVDLYPRYKKALLELAHYYKEKGDYKDAEIYYYKYLAVYPNDGNIAIELAQLLAKEGKYEEAKRLLRSVIDNSQNPQVVQRAYRVVNQILIEEAQSKLKKQNSP